MMMLDSLEGLMLSALAGVAVGSTIVVMDGLETLGVMAAAIAAILTAGTLLYRRVVTPIRRRRREALEQAVQLIIKEFSGHEGASLSKAFTSLAEKIDRHIEVSHQDRRNLWTATNMLINSMSDLKRQVQELEDEIHGLQKADEEIVRVVDEIREDT